MTEPRKIALALLACLPMIGLADTDRSKVDALFAKWDSTVTPGCSLAVSRDGTVIHARGYGMADLEHDAPNTPGTVFHIASVSKQFTAAAIALLAQDGKLSIDDDVRRYVPELPDYGKRITIRQLANHTSGLRNQWEFLEMAGWRYSRDLITDDDVMALVKAQRSLNFEPGSQYSYSNTGYFLMAVIVERVSGKSLREFTTERIFQPLGMTRTFFRDDFTEIVRDIAHGYTPGESGFRTSVTNFDTVGPTSLLTTVEDLMRWEENFYTGLVGGRELARQMVTPGVLGDGSEIAYAFGVVNGSYRGLRTVNHEGQDAGYVSQLIRFPDQHLSIALLCNVDHAGPGELANAAADIFLAKELGPTKATTTAKPAARIARAQLEALQGLYVHRPDGQVMRVVARDGRLLAVSGEEESEFQPSGGNRYTLHGGWVDAQFTTTTGGGRQLSVSEWINKPRVFERVPAPAPATKGLEEYAGTYESDELGLPYLVSVRDGKLMIGSLKLSPVPLEATDRDLFNGEWINATFSRDATGKVSGLLLNTGGLGRYPLVKAR